MNQRLRVEDVDSPLCEVRPVKSVLLVVLTGDRGLCGGYNNFIIKRVSRTLGWAGGLGGGADEQAGAAGGQGFLRTAGGKKEEGSSLWGRSDSQSGSKRVE